MALRPKPHYTTRLPGKLAKLPQRSLLCLPLPAVRLGVSWRPAGATVPRLCRVASLVVDKSRTCMFPWPSISKPEMPHGVHEGMGEGRG